MRGTAIPIVEKLPERMGMAFSLLERITDGIENQKCTRLQDFAFTVLKIFRGLISLDPAEAHPVLGPRHQFPLGSPEFVYKTTTVSVN